jgi:hypothetical protein
MASPSAVSRAFSVSVALALAAFAVGCGNGGETTAAPLTKAQFIKQADAICTRGQQRFQELFDGYMRQTPNPTPAPERTLAQWTEIVETAFAPALEREIDELRALTAPRADERQVNAILAAVEDGLRGVEKDPSVEADAEEQFRKSTRLADEYGLTVCGR